MGSTMHDQRYLCPLSIFARFPLCQLSAQRNCNATTDLTDGMSWENSDAAGNSSSGCANTCRRAFQCDSPHWDISDSQSHAAVDFNSSRFLVSLGNNNSPAVCSQQSTRKMCRPVRGQSKHRVDFDMIYGTDCKFRSSSSSSGSRHGIGGYCLATRQQQQRPGGLDSCMVSPASSRCCYYILDGTTRTNSGTVGVSQSCSNISAILIPLSCNQSNQGNKQDRKLSDDSSGCHVDNRHPPSSHGAAKLAADFCVPHWNIYEYGDFREVPRGQSQIFDPMLDTNLHREGIILDNYNRLLQVNPRFRKPQPMYHLR